LIKSGERKYGLAYAISNGMRAMAVNVDEASGVAGLIKVGDRVDIIAKLNGEEGSMPPRTVVVLQGVNVLAIGSSLENAKPDSKEKPLVKTVTLAVTLEDSLRLKTAVEGGKISLILRAPSDKGFSNQQHLVPAVFRLMLLPWLAVDKSTICNSCNSNYGSNVFMLVEGEPNVDKIRILIASNNQAYREALTSNLSHENDLRIIGEVPDGIQAIKKTEQLLPDIVVIEVDLPSGQGITAVEKITLAHPEVGVIVIGLENDSESFRKAMMAGARDYFVKEQLSAGELAEAIRRIFLTEKTRLASYASVRRAEQHNKNKVPQVVTVFGAKGGAGKTTLAVNLAVMIAQESKKRVVLLDLDLQFGDVAVYLNLKPRRTLAELVQERNQWDMQLLSNYLVPHSSGIKVMASPLRHEDADLIVPEHVEKILSLCEIILIYYY
jgi:DNA-binding NarL/FixJ family response regulator